MGLSSSCPAFGYPADVSPHTARIAVLPREVASQVITGAVSRAGWAVGVGVLVMDIIIVIDMVGRRSGPAATAVPLLALGGMLALLGIVGVWPSNATRLLFLGGGAVLAIIYQSHILLTDPALNDGASFLLNRPAFVLVISFPGIVRPLIGLAWGGIGYLSAIGSILVADLIAGVGINTGWGPTIAFVIYTAAYVILAGIRANQAGQLPDLVRLEDDTRRLALEHQYEQRAAALIHDTVLNDLTVVMNSVGPLDERTTSRFRSDVATLTDASWLRESRGATAHDAQDAALRNGMVALVSEAQWKGLTVDITGNPEDQVVRMPPERIAAVHAAVRACLDNVLQHAQTGSAELVMGAGDGFATVLVIDQGVGFDVDQVAGDRLGLRASIVHRIEEQGGSVRIWSKPGSGTSIMITVPCEVDSEEVAGGS